VGKNVKIKDILVKFLIKESHEAVSKALKFHAANATRKTTQRQIDSFQIAAFFAFIASVARKYF
jgi:hypothetical protein